MSCGPSGRPRRACDGRPRWNEHDAEALALLPGLRGLFEDACSRYGARKRSLHALDFLDLELHAVRLLREHEAVAEECRRRFRYVMVDECQDTNPLQVELIRLLTGRRDGSPGAVRLFAVGDQKQAIYRFRGSDVRHFGRLAREIEASGGRALPLSRSFRAHDPLVGTLNEIFGAVFERAGGEFEVPMQAMTGRGGEAPGGMHLVAAPVAERGPGGERAGPRDVLRVEADLVAGEIAALLERGDPVWDRRLGGYRPVRPGDVAILLRRLRNLHDFEHALESRGVPYATPAGGGFFSRPEVVDLTNLLRWIAEPDDEIALLGVLRSPMVLLDDPTLLELRRDRGRLFPGLASPPQAVAPEMRARARTAHALLADLRAHAGSVPTHELLAEALERSGVESVWGALRGGEQSLANIRKFVRLARELADRPLDGFVDYVERRRDDLDAREGQAVVDRPDAVQLMTVHAAKGLEFPVVLVPEGQSEAFSGWETVRWRPGEGLSVTLLPEPEATDRRRLRPGLYAWLRERDLAEEEAEHDRLLYVAATRAADYLYISGSGNAKGWLGTVRAALAEAGRDGVELRESVPADMSAVARRLSPAAVRPPEEAEEREYVPPLLARPPVIPVRASTPVTAFRPRPEAAGGVRARRRAGGAPGHGRPPSHRARLHGSGPAGRGGAHPGGVGAAPGRGARPVPGGRDRGDARALRALPARRHAPRSGDGAPLRAPLRVELGRRPGARRHRSRLPGRAGLARRRLQDGRVQGADARGGVGPLPRAARALRRRHRARHRRAARLRAALPQGRRAPRAGRGRARGGARGRPRAGRRRRRSRAGDRRFARDGGVARVIPPQDVHARSGRALAVGSYPASPRPRDRVACSG